VPEKKEEQKEKKKSANYDMFTDFVSGSPTQSKK
jgi:hypothetical protein